MLSSQIYNLNCLKTKMSMHYEYFDGKAMQRWTIVNKSDMNGKTLRNTALTEL